MIIKKYIKRLLGRNVINSINNYRRLIKTINKLLQNYYVDLKKYLKYSTLINSNDLKQIESLIILDYHALEKGFLHHDIRYKFAKEKIIRLLYNIKRFLILEEGSNSQVIAACSVLKHYYNIHKQNNVNIEEYFNQEDYFMVCKFADSNYLGYSNINLNDYFKDINKSFLEFSISRHSVREYNGSIIPDECIEKVITLAKNAPSVCNRQAGKVYLINEKQIIDKILNIQQGIKGFSNNINQLIILTEDIKYFYTVGERNQLYIDGGIFLMNLLYAFHYNKIGACPLHWALEKQHDLELCKLINIPPSEKIICLISIGVPTNNFTVTLSKRRENGEIFKIIS